MTSTYEDRTLLATDVAIKAPCRSATTANITLNGLQTVDGIALAANDRVLVKNQTSGVNNGIYLASTGSWTRTSDFDGNRDAVDGTLVLVRLGTASALALYELSCAASPANIGTTSLTFNLVSVIVGNAGSFTTLTASGQITSSLATGTAPLVIASTTKVANLNVDLLDGTDWNAPGVIGGGTPGPATFTTVTATGAMAGATVAATGLVSGATGKVTTTFGVGNTTPAVNGAGVSFPAAQSASTDVNTLDDYEEGTWTPSIGGSATYLNQTATYTKIGRLVFIHCHLQINAIGTGSTTVISGLPFGSSIDSPLATGGVSNLATAVVSLTGYVSSGGGTTISISSRVAANAADGGSAIFGNNANVEISGCYIT